MAYFIEIYPRIYTIITLLLFLFGMLLLFIHGLWWLITEDSPLMVWEGVDDKVAHIKKNRIRTFIGTLVVIILYIIIPSTL